MEDRLDTMSSALLAMTELLKSNGICQDNKDNNDNNQKKLKTTSHDRGKANDPIGLTESNSGTTIYQNALET